MAKALGVKEAMKHFASTIGSGGIENPANTIKGLTKQILHGIGGFDLQNARTIAEIWTIAGGYEPEPNTPVGVKEAMRYAVSGFGVENPATTIKGLTKQILMVFLNSFGVDQEAIAEIQNARTIAQAWELAAIANGYEPPEEGGEEGPKVAYLALDGSIVEPSDFNSASEIYQYCLEHAVNEKVSNKLLILYLGPDKEDNPCGDGFKLPNEDKFMWHDESGNYRVKIDINDIGVYSED